MRNFPIRLLLVTSLFCTTAFSQIRVSSVVDVTNDSLSQNETALAVNPANANNMITGGNDWNYNDGCSLSTTFDGGKSWTPALPNGFLPGVTKYTNDPSVAGTGAYDAGGDPAIAFGPYKGNSRAYYVCQAFNFTSPYQIAMLVNTSDDGGQTWKSQNLTQVTVWNGNGKSKGSNGQFPDHESIYVDRNPSSPYFGRVYVTWVQFSGNVHSPVHIAWSDDGAQTFSSPVQITSGTVRNNQDARVVSGNDGTVFLTFDNGVQGGKGTVLYVSSSKDGGATWSTPYQFVTLINPVCTFPASCFNISGGAFRSGGTYPVPAYDPVRDRLYVIYPDIVGTYAQVYFTWASATDITKWTTPVAIVPANGDRFQNEMSVSPSGRIDVSFYDRSYSGNALVDLTYATSNDGGATWATKRVSSSSFDPAAWGVPSSAASGFRPFLGDYNGIYSLVDGAGMTWTGVGGTGQPLNLEIDFARTTVK